MQNTYLQQINPQAFIMHLGPHKFLFSYGTLMGYQGPICDAGVRRPSPSTTTSKHLTFMGAKHWREDDERLDKIISQFHAFAND